MSATPASHEIVLGGYRMTTADLNVSLFLGFSEEDIPVLHRLRDPDARGQAGVITDRYGIKTRTANLWAEMAPHDGAFTDVPVPGNFHWETMEWVAIIRSVLQAEGGRYRIMELGAGWGPAVVAGSVLARLHGLHDVEAVAVEADPHHVRFIREHAELNRIDPARLTILEAAVGLTDGVAEWPDAQETAFEFGNRPITDEGDYLGRPIAKTKQVRVVAFTDLLNRQPEWDLLHVDIQGAEAEIFADCMDKCEERVARVCVGTHSRKIDGDLLDLFYRRGWHLENEKPTKMTFVQGARTMEAMNSGDGVQVWRNPRLRPLACA